MTARTAVAVIACILLAGCMTTVAGTPSTAPPAAVAPSAAESVLPSRPRELPVGTLDPCTVLTPVQLAQLTVANEYSGTDPDGNPVCGWSRLLDEPRDVYQVALDPGRGAEYALGSTEELRVISVAGFAVVESQAPSFPPESHCLLAIDVAAGQNVRLLYQYDGSTVPMTKERACEMAAAAAELVILTLIELTDG